MAHERACPQPGPSRRSFGVVGAAFGILLLLALGCSEPQKRKLAIGDPCDPANPAECNEGLCVPLDDASGFCTHNCAQDGKCPDEFRCEDSGQWGLICKKPPQCKGDTDCPSGHRCNLGNGQCYIKVSRGLCSPCTDDLQCPQGGACFTVPATGERYCTSACGEGRTCPVGYACKDVPIYKTGEATPALTPQCVPEAEGGSCEAGRDLCAPCKGDQECGGFFDLCVRNVVSAETFCGKTCALDRAEDCPIGFQCLDLSGTGAGPNQCVPISNSCEGYCDSTDEHEQVLQCGLAHTCDLGAKRCQAATDGRECAPCTSDDDCRKPGHESNACVVTDSGDYQGESFCAEPCPAGGDADCQARFGPGFVCAPAGSNHYCVPQRGSCKAGLGQLGDACPSGAIDCVTGICLDYGKTALCSATCKASADCGDERTFQCCKLVGDFYDCSATFDPAQGTGVCAPKGGLFGDDCSPGRPPCQSGTCLDIGTARLCTVPCAADGTCPTDFVCRDAFPEPGAPALRICFPDGGGEPGSDCTFGPAACADRLCIKKSSGPICTKACTGAGTCPTDWACLETRTVTEELIQACMPPGLQ